jgi:hypothetical protein
LTELDNAQTDADNNLKFWNRVEIGLRYFGGIVGSLSAVLTLVAVATERQRKPDLKDETRSFLVLLLVGFVGLIVFGLYSQLYHPLFLYDIAEDHVLRSFKPIDCDYDAAPTGKKGCHYEKQVVILNKQGSVVGGDEILPDGSHVWTEPKRPVTDARIDWVKIEDSAAFEYKQHKAHETPAAPISPAQDPAAVELCIRRLKARPDYQETDEDHVKQACAADASLWNQ